MTLICDVCDKPLDYIHLELTTSGASGFIGTIAHVHPECVKNLRFSEKWHERMNQVIDELSYRIAEQKKYRGEQMAERTQKHKNAGTG